MIPEFESNGQLPPGVHEASWEELETKCACNSQRKRLFAGLKRAARALKGAGCERLYLDGSFVTKKNVPADFDGCWSVKGVDPLKLDPVLLEFANGRAAQKSKFFGELFPADLTEGNSGKTWLDFFQLDKDTGVPKGVVTIDLKAEIP